MSDFYPEQLESELRALQPVRPPRETIDRVLKCLPSQAAQPAVTTAPGFAGRWPRLLKILIPAGAVTVLLATWVIQRQTPAPTQQSQHAGSSAHSPLRADKVEIDRQLVADFDAVGRLPSGEPVRFRCQQWMEKVKLRDTAKGLVIEQTTPHLEIVPVRFETY
jgi:hypothetical protein